MFADLLVLLGLVLVVMLVYLFWWGGLGDCCGLGIWLVGLVCFWFYGGCIYSVG